MVALHPTVVVSGATGAIGSATAAVLARRGARVIVLSRPSDRLNALVDRLGGDDNRISSVPVDLSSMSSVRAGAREINRAGGHIDALLNVAAVFLRDYNKTSDGFELMLATNYFGPFLLTNLLRDRLVGGGRVITVAAPSNTRIDMERLFAKKRFDALHTFGATKALDLMFTFELARRAKRWDVMSNAFHPGLVRSELMREAARPIRFLAGLASGSAHRPAQDLVELAISPAHAGTTGWFFKGTRRIDPPKSAADEAVQAAIWQRTAELVEMEIGGF
ncbi:MAG TPA: SDR family NAD(P)-dependent oxidoreductase [Candidatus Dormibacteraeota bacterium]|nr:SDR family NAD(P)-dependent oxidoreductase [Candidatus Dormibacteraeota bacterium]